MRTKAQLRADAPRVCDIIEAPNELAGAFEKYCGYHCSRECLNSGCLVADSLWEQGVIHERCHMARCCVEFAFLPYKRVSKELVKLGIVHKPF